MKMTAGITVQYDCTVGELKRALQDIPENAKVSIRTHQADRFGSDSHTVEFSWET
jgi:hypothetical protein